MYYEDVNNVPGFTKYSTWKSAMAILLLLWTQTIATTHTHLYNGIPRRPPGREEVSPWQLVLSEGRRSAGFLLREVHRHSPVVGGMNSHEDGDLFIQRGR